MASQTLISSVELIEQEKGFNPHAREKEKEGGQRGESGRQWQFDRLGHLQSFALHS